MSVNEKLLQYADYKGYSQRKFTSMLGLAEGVLRRGKNIGSGYLKNVREKCHDLNMDWLLFDEGEMLIDEKTAEKANAVSEAIEDYQLIKKALAHTLISLDEKEEELKALKKKANE